MIGVSDSELFIYNGTFQNCSAQNFTIFAIYNSSFCLENIQFSDFQSHLIYSPLGFIKIHHCFFNNFNDNNDQKDFAIMMEKNVSFMITNSLFQNLSNFVKVIHD